MGKPERKRPLGRPRRRWSNNIKMDRPIKEMGVRVSSGYNRSTAGPSGGFLKTQ
jgi:hypothetical protein